MKVSELVSKAEMFHLPKARNLRDVGWADGYMLVRFRSKPTLWIYGPDIPAEELPKLLRVPYPDKLFTQNIKNKFRCHKAG